MYRFFLLILTLTGMVLISCTGNSGDVRTEEDAVLSTNLSVGDHAPQFTLPGTPDGNDIVLGNELSVQPVLLAFYPKAFTGG